MRSTIPGFPHQTLTSTSSIPTEGEPQQNDTSTALDTRTASLVTTTSTEAFTEHCLQPHLGQSRIDGRLGGSACTIIAMLTAHRFLCRILALQMSHEKGGQLLTESIEVFLG